MDRPDQGSRHRAGMSRGSLSSGRDPEFETTSDTAN
jgi:hypothetical protein